MITTPASERFGVTAAPSRLAALQDLVNTDAGGAEDLLASTATAAEWAAHALGDSIEPSWEVAETGLVRLRVIREQLRQLLRRAGGTLPRMASATAVLTVGPSGSIELRPRGRGLASVESALLIAARDAQATGDWERLKLCKNDACSVAFFDRSRNNSGVWHDVHTCGNAANLRASRARRRARDAL